MNYVVRYLYSTYRSRQTLISSIIRELKYVVMIASLLSLARVRFLSFQLLVILMASVLVTCATTVHELHQNPSYRILENSTNIQRLDSVSLRLSFAHPIHDVIKHTERYQNETPDHFRLKIKYQLILDVLHFRLKPLCAAPVLGNEQSDIEICKGQLNMFGSYNDSLDKDYSYLFEHCQEHRLSMNVTGSAKDDFLTITGLLPHQRYYFEVSLEYSGEDNTIQEISKSSLPICMPDSSPLFAPQTDIGSFRIEKLLGDRLEKDRQLEGVRRVELYWRPVPHLLAGSEYLDSEINCIDEHKVPFYFTIIKDTFSGVKDIETPFLSNVSYQCTLRSRNNLGYSADSSAVFIPKQDSILETQGRFNLYVAAVTNLEYILRWTDMDQYISELEGRASSTLDIKNSHTRTYTLYWCILSSQARGCSSIEGMKRTNETQLALYIPGDGKPQNRIFGISYRTAGNKNFTGIVWSDCVATVRSQAQSAYHAPEVIRAVGMTDHSKISVTWVVKGCKSLIALVDAYEVNYCKAGPIDPCSTIPIAKISADESFDRKFHELDECNTIIVPNKLSSETVLDGLNSSTKYIIRMRIKVVNETSLWSNPVLSHTIADLANAKECSRRQHPIFTIILVVITIAAIAIIYIPARRLFVHYWDILFRYRHANIEIPARIEETNDKKDNLSELGLRYWINRFPTPNNSAANSESSLSNFKLDTKNGKILRTFAEDSPTDDEDDYVQQPLTMHNYIPSQLLTDQEHSSIPYNLNKSSKEDKRDSLSYTDDISVTSHSSFLENILNDNNSDFNETST